MNYSSLITLLVIFLLVIVALIWRYVLPALIQSSTKVWFEKQLDEHRHQLATILEATKFDFTRLGNDYSLFNQKRHECYSLLYKLLLRAEEHLSRRAQKVVERTRFDDYTAVGIRKVLEDMGLPDKVIGEICNKWDVNIDAAHEDIYHWQGIIDQINTRKAVAEFHNEYLSWELYVSPDVSRKLSQVDKVILDTQVHVKSHWDAFQGPAHFPEVVDWRMEISRRLEESLEQLSTLKVELKVLMQQELQRATP